MANEKITKDMIIGNVLREYPETAPAFMASGMHCLGCPGAQMETIEQAAMVHGMDLETLLVEVNKVIEK